MSVVEECKAYIAEFFKCYENHGDVKYCGPPYYNFSQCLNRL